MDSGPPTPTSHRRRSSVLSGPRTPTNLNSRPTSRHVTPSHHRRTSSRLSNFDNSLLETSAISAGDNGLGNLEDELADVWDGDEGFENSHLDDTQFSHVESSFDAEKIRDSGIDVSSNDPGTPKEHLSPRALKIPTVPAVHQRSSSLYDGSDYNDFGSPIEDISHTLKAAMADVEALSKQDFSDTSEDPIRRMIERLRDLGNPAALENGCTRLATGQKSLAAHIVDQGRITHQLSFNLFAPGQSDVIDPRPATIPHPVMQDTSAREMELDNLIESTIVSLPKTSASIVDGLHSLSDHDESLIKSLRELNDSLHMARQASEDAARNLRAAQDKVAQLRRESSVSESAQIWLEDGNWHQKLQQRQCAQTCRDVVGGFEEYCNGLRKSLEAQAQAQAAA